MTLAKGKMAAYEKKDKAMDKRMGIKEDSAKDKKKDAAAMKKKK